MKKLNFIYRLLLFFFFPLLSYGENLPQLAQFAWGKESCDALQIGLFLQGQQARYGNQIPFWIALKNNSDQNRKMTLYYDLDEHERILLHVNSLERAVSENFPGLRTHLPSRHGFSIAVELKAKEAYIHPGHFLFLGSKFTGKNEVYLSFDPGPYSQCQLLSPKLALKISP